MHLKFIESGSKLPADHSIVRPAHGQAGPRRRPASTSTIVHAANA